MRSCRRAGFRAIVDENWAAMERFMARAAETKYRTADLPEVCNYQWNDWLSLTKYESCPFKSEYDAFDGRRRPKPEALLYWNYLGGCCWLWDAQMMTAMAEATGRTEAASRYRRMADEAKAYLKAGIPEGVTADVTVPGDNRVRRYTAGRYQIRK